MTSALAPVYAVEMRAAVILAVVAACGGGHHHGPAAHPGDARHLYVEVFVDGSHRRALRDGATRGLAKVGFIVASERGGDVEIQVETAKLASAGKSTTCSVKILVFRLPQHDLLGIADGSARAAGDSDDAAAECVRQLGEALVAGKVRPLFVRQLGAKR